MANLAELALVEAVLKTLIKRLGDEVDSTRDAMQAALEVTGASQVRATLPDGTRVATASLTDPRVTASVADPEAFLAWAQEHTPGEVTTVTMVRPAYQAEVLRRVRASGAAELPDPVTGESRPVPGVTVSVSEATHSVRLAEDGAEQIDAAWRSGALRHLNLPQLVPGVGDDRG